MNDRTVLITGINGFIGSHLQKTLKKTFPDSRVFGLDLRESRSADVFKVDLLKGESLLSVITEIRPDFIFHLAGVIYSRDWGEHYRGNVETTANVLEAVKRCGLKSRVIVPGSAAEYGRISGGDLPITERQLPNPVSPYGVAKVWQTTVVRYYATNGADAVIGRMFNIIGKGAPSGLSIGAFAEQLKKIKHTELPPKIMVGNLKPKRDFVDIADACRGLIALAEKGRRGEVYNICSGRSVSMEELLLMMIENSGLDIEIEVDSSRFKDADIEDIFGSNEKILRETGWRPSLTLEQSVAEVVSGF